MKNYPLWKSLLVIIVVIAGIVFSIPSIIYSENSSNWFLQNKINLGLDLQGGSYLLLQVESEVLLEEEFENISDTVRLISRNEKTNFINIVSKDNYIEFLYENDLSIKEIRNELIANYRDIDVVINDNTMKVILNDNFKKRIEESAIKQSLEIVILCKRKLQL